MIKGIGIRMKWKITSCFVLMLGMFSGALTGCGVAEQDSATSSVSQPREDVPTEGVQPDIHLNVPPPSVHQEFSDQYNQVKSQMNNFSPDLKLAIANNAAKFFSPSPGGDETEVSTDNSTPSQGNGDDAAAPSPPVFHTLMGGTLPLEEDGNCDPKAQFLCLDAPRPPEGFSQVYTIDAGVDVVVRMDLTQLAVFGSQDPVAIVSIFNSDSGGAATEMLIMPEDVQSTSDPDVGRFETAVPLGGNGKFTIVVSAYRNINDGEANELFSKMVEVYRTGQADIEFVEAKKLTQGTLGTEVSDGDTISAEALQLTVKLLSTYSPGIQIRFENYDEAGHLKGFVAVGHVSSLQGQFDGTDWSYTAPLLLHLGVNEIRIVASNPQLEAQLGDQAPDSMTLTFTVTNFFGRPTLKVISPDPAEPLVAQHSEHQKVELSFCYTMIPELAAEGRGAADPDQCITGSLGLEACLFVNGRKIGMVGGGPNPDGDTIDYNPAEGVFTARVTPDFGINLYQINVTEDKCETALFTQAGSFIFGQPHPMIEDGVIGEDGLFTQRGVHLDVDRSFLEGEVKGAIQAFLDRPETADMILGIFKSTARKPGYTCDDFIDPNTGRPVQSNGDTSIEFLEDSFTLGPGDGSGRAIELKSLTTGSSGMLELSVVLNGMHGEADLTPVESTGNTFNGMDLGFLPISFAIQKLEMNIGVAFPLDHKAIDSDGDGEKDTRRLDLKTLPGKELFRITGDGPLGKAIYINSSRNPLAAGLELLDWQSNLLGNTFNAIMGGTLLCGIEEGQNNTSSGVIGKAAVDLQNIQSKNPNIFRLSFDQEILGKQIKLDVAVDALKAEIEFDEEGIHVRNIPVRANPAASVLSTLATEFEKGILGPVSRYRITAEQDPQKNITNSTHVLGVEIGEDVINQALFAAVGAGLLDLGVDAKFYKEKEIIPNEEIAPNGAKLAPGVDINRDGVVDESDEMTPVRLELSPDKRMPPTVSFLSDEEVARFITEEEASADSGDDSGTTDPSGDTPPPDESPTHPYWVAGQTYFRIAVANLEIAAYKQEFIPESLGGLRHYCKKTWSDDPSIPAKGFCNISSAVLVDDNDIPNDQPGCEDGEVVSMTNDNGVKLSHQSRTLANADEVVPLYRIRMNAVLHGKISGINREISAKERIQDPQAPVRTVLHMQFAPSPISPRALIPAVEVIENNTNISDEEIISRWDTILTGAIGDRCRGLNELRIPINDSIEFDPEKEGLIQDIGLTAIDLGTDPETLPEAFIDDNRLYLDLLLAADLKFEGDDSSSDDGGMGNP